MSWLEPQPLPSGMAANTLADRVEATLKMSDPTAALVALIKELFTERLDAGQILGVLEGSRAQLRRDDREADEDVVMEVMDRLVGWCNPQETLRPSAETYSRSHAS